MTLSWYDKVLILKSWVEYNVLKILHSIHLSIGVSLAISITCFHSTTNNLTLLCSVSVVQSQDPLHVLIVWQKTSLCCAQLQFFNPKSHYMFPQYNKKHHFAVLSFSFSMPSPIICFHSITKNITLLCSVSGFQSQIPLHVSIVWQKTSIPSPVTCIQWITKSSIQSSLPSRNHTSNSCVRVLLKGMVWHWVYCSLPLQYAHH